MRGVAVGLGMAVLMGVGESELLKPGFGAEGTSAPPLHPENQARQSERKAREREVFFFKGGTSNPI